MVYTAVTALYAFFPKVHIYEVLRSCSYLYLVIINLNILDNRKHTMLLKFNLLYEKVENMVYKKCGNGQEP